MEDETFDELLESVKEMGRIIRGEIEPSRRFVWNTRDFNAALEKSKDNKWNPVTTDPYNNTIIICQYCHKNSGYTEEGFRHYVISSDIKCKNCGKVIIEYNGGIRC